MTEHSKKNVTIHRPVLVALLLGAFALGVFIDRGLLIVTGGQPEEAENRPGSTLLQTKKNLSALQTSVNTMVKQKLTESEASAISLYYYDFRSNADFGIGEEVKFFPHSLLKLPVMLVYFKKAESDPDLLQKMLAYTGPRHDQPTPLIKPLKALKTGTSYSIQDLIYRMLVYGDDDAYSLLSSALPEDALDRLYADLSLEYEPASDDDPMSLKDYASFYRVLFNEAYLDKRMSSKALTYLSQSSFRNGMVAGIPPNVRIASRFGISTLPVDAGNAPKELIQLHEIGVIYYPNHPFLLGVSIRGNDLAKMERAVRDIGNLVYREVDLQQKERLP